jgi:signal transduction histidine kinase
MFSVNASPLPDADENDRLRRLGYLAAGLASEISTPMQYVGDNARFLSEAVDDLRGILAWYQACLRVLAGKRQPELLAEIAAMERKVDLPQLLTDIPLALAQSLEGIGRVSSLTHAFKDFCHAGADPIRLDVRQALRKVLEVTQNQWRQRTDISIDIGDLPRIIATPRDLDLALVDVVLAAATYCGPPGRPVVVTASRRTREVALRLSAVGTAASSSALGRRGEPCDLSSTRALLAPMGARVDTESDDDGWAFIVAFPVAADPPAADAGAWA